MVVKELAFMTLRSVCEGEVRVREDLIILFSVVESCAVTPVCASRGEDGEGENTILCPTAFIMGLSMYDSLIRS